MKHENIENQIPKCQKCNGRGYIIGTFSDVWGDKDISPVKEICDCQKQNPIKITAITLVGEGFHADIDTDTDPAIYQDIIEKVNPTIRDILLQIKEQYKKD